MHNITSGNQLGEWTVLEDDLVNDYYECLIECDTNHQSNCKRICRSILTDQVNQCL